MAFSGGAEPEVGTGGSPSSSRGTVSFRTVARDQAVRPGAVRAGRRPACGYAGLSEPPTISSYPLSSLQ